MVRLVGVICGAALAATCCACSSQDDRAGGDGGDGGGGAGAGGASGGSGSGSGAYGPFTLPCAPGEIRLAGVLGGVDQSLIEDADIGCSFYNGTTRAELRCSVELASGEVGLIVHTEHTGGYLVGGQVAPARVWLGLADLSSQANCATEPPVSSFAYRVNRSRRFIATGLRVYTQPGCGPGGPHCPEPTVFDDVCSGAPVEGTIEGCLWQ